MVRKSSKLFLWHMRFVFNKLETSLGRFDIFTPAYGKTRLDDLSIPDRSLELCIFKTTEPDCCTLLLSV